MPSTSPYQDVEGLDMSTTTPIEASSSRKGAIAKAALVFTATAGAVAAVSSHLRKQAAASTTSMRVLPFNDDEYDAVGPYTQESYNCADYDDDSYFTADVCSAYDVSTCFGTNSIVTSCTDSFWCNKLCGDMCNDGAGAMCFFQKISDLKTTCGTVANLRATQNVSYNPFAPYNVSAAYATRHGLKQFDDDTSAEVTDDEIGDSCGKGCSAEMVEETAAQIKERQNMNVRAWRKDLILPEAQDAEDAEEVGHGLSEDISDEGCGRHSYCRECTSFCKEQAMKIYLSRNFKTAGGYSPQALKQALENVIQTCAAFGMYV